MISYAFKQRSANFFLSNFVFQIPMQMDGFNFKYYAHKDVKEIQQKMTNAALNWEEFCFRQERHKHHRETKTIPLIFNEENLFKLKYWDNFELFRNEIKEIQLLIEEANNSKGTLHSAIFINLPARSKIYAHTDLGPIFRVSHRIHLPIFTNPDCLFTVDGKTINMKEGDIWEINNDGKKHDVVNNGDSDRIHLLMDWKPVMPL